MHSELIIYTSDLPGESLVGTIVKAIYPHARHIYDKPDNLRKLKKYRGWRPCYSFRKFFPKCRYRFLLFSYSIRF